MTYQNLQINKAPVEMETCYNKSLLIFNQTRGVTLTHQKIQTRELTHLNSILKQGL